MQINVKEMKDRYWCDLRTLNVHEHPSVGRYYHVDEVPCCVLVVSIGKGDYDTGVRLNYPYTFEELEALNNLIPRVRDAFTSESELWKTWQKFKL